MTMHFCNNKTLFITFDEVNDIIMPLATGNSESRLIQKGIIKFAINLNDTITKNYIK